MGLGIKLAAPLPLPGFPALVERLIPGLFGTAIRRIAEKTAYAINTQK
jgi:hypothetical protein